jgi:hypothetical protein
LINNAWPWCVPDFNVFFNEAKVALAAKGITALDGTTLRGLRGTACIRLEREGFADSVIADMVGMSIAMVEHYTGLKTSGRPASPCWRCSRRARLAPRTIRQHRIVKHWKT